MHRTNSFCRTVSQVLQKYDGRPFFAEYTTSRLKLLAGQIPAGDRIIEWVWSTNGFVQGACLSLGVTGLSD
ncbi:hypothetical protein ACFPTO_21660 [Paraburkholderia denitrificans]|uniref:Uncharacterized protein n=1 Tax=Paraburkholderia denitrificans TaxID=694025 RepID=A0ABW0JDY6_9BURK